MCLQCGNAVATLTPGRAITPIGIKEVSLTEKRFTQY